jgi:hypothetical protein
LPSKSGKNLDEVMSGLMVMPAKYCVIFDGFNVPNQWLCDFDGKNFKGKKLLTGVNNGGWRCLRRKPIERCLPVSLLGSRWVTWLPRRLK